MQNADVTNPICATSSTPVRMFSIKQARASTDRPPPSSQLALDRSLNTSGNELTQHQSDLLELQARAEGAKVAALSAVVEGKDAESDATTLHREVDCESFFFLSALCRNTPAEFLASDGGVKPSRRKQIGSAGGSGLRFE